jgi:transcription elongation factor Elf1
MKLSGLDAAKSDKTQTVASVQCPWCEHVAEIPYGPQHRYGTMDVHCPSCSRYFSNRVADAWFDQHDQKLQDEREVWKRIPEDAYLTARHAPTLGASIVYTLYLGKGDPVEYFARDSVEHKLVNEFGMSWYQASAIVNSAALDAGRKIYFQRLTKISSALLDRLQKIGKDGTPTITAGTPIRFNGHNGIFLRASHHDGFAVVALNGLGDTEIPMLELEVIDVSSEAEFEGDDGSSNGKGVLQQIEELEKTVEEVEHRVEDAESGVMDAIQNLGGSVGEEPADSPDFGVEEHDDEEHDDSEEFEADEDEDEEDLVVSFDDEDDEKEAQTILSAGDLSKRAQGSSPEERRTTLMSIINDPMSDPEVISAAQRALGKMQQQPTQPAAPGMGMGMTTGAVDEDEGYTGSCPVCGSERAIELGAIGNRYHVRCRDCGMERSREAQTEEGIKKISWWYKAPKEIQSQYPKDVSSIGDGNSDATKDSELYPKKDKDLYPKTVTKASTQRTALNRDAQRKVHTHYTHSQDLRRAITVNRNELGIEDIRYLLAHYINTGHLAKHDADDLANWFIGSKPRLLSARDMMNRSCLSAADFQKAALLEKGIGVFTPALYKGKEVFVMAIDNTGTKATVQDSDKRQIEVAVRDLTPAKEGPYSGEPGDSYSRTKVHKKKD